MKKITSNEKMVNLEEEKYEKNKNTRLHEVKTNFYMDSPRRKNRKDGRIYCQVVNDYEVIDENKGDDRNKKQKRQNNFADDVELDDWESVKTAYKNSAQSTNTILTSTPKKSIQQLKQEYLNSNIGNGIKVSQKNIQNTAEDTIGSQMTASMFRSGRPPIEGMDAPVADHNDNIEEKCHDPHEKPFRVCKATLRRIPLLKEQPLLDDRGLLEEHTDESASTTIDPPSSIDDNFEYDDYISTLPDSIFDTQPSAYTLTWNRAQDPWVGRGFDP